MAKPNRNPTENAPRTPTEQPHAGRTSPKGEQGASEHPDEEITATQDEDDDGFEDVDEVDEDDEEAEDEDETMERH